MSKTLKQQNNSKEFSITDRDMAYIQLFQAAALDMYNYHRNLVQRYLAILAGEKWGYPPEAELNFEIDPEHKKIRVTPAEKT